MEQKNQGKVDAQQQQQNPAKSTPAGQQPEAQKGKGEGATYLAFNDAWDSGNLTDIEGGYRIEASVPLVTDVWQITPEHLGVLGFQAHLNGSSGSDRDTKLIWSRADVQDQSWTNPSLFGRLIFWDKNQ